jgi:hypothetical protein
VELITKEDLITSFEHEHFLIHLDDDWEGTFIDFLKSDKVKYEFQLEFLTDGKFVSERVKRGIVLKQLKHIKNFIPLPFKKKYFDDLLKKVNSKYGKYGDMSTKEAIGFLIENKESRFLAARAFNAFHKRYYYSALYSVVAAITADGLKIVGLPEEDAYPDWITNLYKQKEEIICFLETINKKP